MTRSKQQKVVFFIYAHRDKEAVHKLYRRICREGINTWLDTEKLQPGQNWKYEIRKSILHSDIVIVCLSRAFNQQQGYRHEELKIALKKAALFSEGEVFIIPARLESCELPASLRHLHCVDLFEANGYRKLLQALKECL